MVQPLGETLTAQSERSACMCYSIPDRFSDTLSSDGAGVDDLLAVKGDRLDQPLAGQLLERLAGQRAVQLHKKEAAAGFSDLGCRCQRYMKKTIT